NKQGSENIISAHEFWELYSMENADIFIKQLIRMHLIVSNDEHTLRFKHLLIRDYFAFELAYKHLHNEEIPSLHYIKCLGHLEDRRPVPELIRLLERSEGTAYLTIIIETLAKIRDQRAVEAIAKFV